jgi:hypothetical protein
MLYFNYYVHMSSPLPDCLLFMTGATFAFLYIPSNKALTGKYRGRKEGEQLKS